MKTCEADLTSNKRGKDGPILAKNNKARLRQQNHTASKQTFEGFGAYLAHRKVSDSYFPLSES